MSASASRKQAATMTTTAKPPTIVSAATELLRDLASRYTRHHADLEVNGRELGTMLALTIQGHRDDHPKLVGSQGKHIWALQTIFKAAARRAGRPVRLTLLEPARGVKSGPSEFVANPAWTPDSAVELLARILEATTMGGVTAEPLETGDLTTLLIRVENLEDPAALWKTGELAKALHLIFHAIGKTEGRQIHVEVLGPAGEPLNGPAV